MENGFFKGLEEGPELGFTTTHGGQLILPDLDAMTKNLNSNLPRQLRHVIMVGHAARALPDRRDLVRVVIPGVSDGLGELLTQ